MVEVTSVKEILVEDFPKAKEDDVISSVISLFKEWRKEIPVFKGEDYVGMLSPLELLDPKLDVNKTKVKHLLKFYPRLSEENTLFEAAKLMVESYSSALPVFSKDNTKFLGIVKIEDILKFFFEKTNLGKEKAKEVKKSIDIFDENVSLGEIINYLWERKRDYAIINWKGSLYVLHICDIIENILKPKEKIGFGDKIKDPVTEYELKARDFYSYELIMLSSNLNLREILEEMEIRKREVVGIEEDGKFLGVISKKSLLREVLGLYKEEEKVAIKFVGDYYELPLLEQGLFRKSLSSFAEKLGNKYGSGYIKVRIKRHGDKNRYEVSIRAVFPKNTFYANHEGFKLLDVLQECLKKLEREAFDE